eukprot:CAMPEP_0172510770 /NCGR_PEP_ID=MMETSP1066-20121228/231169_1 /TAXON_ID=671091 /ORGANISM="Coscinodiscus wailesii, Strain CCMP2513" /LENGTH=577 /DNA_ID=CAMNT_0013289893 /DNA_START=105 /DNA_END=1835 /DNA_ORIENTATION=+
MALLRKRSKPKTPKKSTSTTNDTIKNGNDITKNDIEDQSPQSSFHNNHHTSFCSSEDEKTPPLGNRGTSRRIDFSLFSSSSKSLSSSSLSRRLAQVQSQGKIDIDENDTDTGATSSNISDSSSSCASSHDAKEGVPVPLGRMDDLDSLDFTTLSCDHHEQDSVEGDAEDCTNEIGDAEGSVTISRVVPPPPSSSSSVGDNSNSSSSPRKGYGWKKMNDNEIPLGNKESSSSSMMKGLKRRSKSKKDINPYAYGLVDDDSDNDDEEDKDNEEQKSSPITLLVESRRTLNTQNFHSTKPSTTFSSPVKQRSRKTLISISPTDSFSNTTISTAPSSLSSTSSITASVSSEPKFAYERFDSLLDRANANKGRSMEQLILPANGSEIQQTQQTRNWQTSNIQEDPIKNTDLKSRHEWQQYHHNSVTNSTSKTTCQSSMMTSNGLLLLAAVPENNDEDVSSTTSSTPQITSDGTKIDPPENTDENNISLNSYRLNNSDVTQALCTSLPCNTSTAANNDNPITSENLLQPDDCDMRLNPEVKDAYDKANQCVVFGIERMEDAIFRMTRDCDAVFHVLTGEKHEW